MIDFTRRVLIGAQGEPIEVFSGQIEETVSQVIDARRWNMARIDVHATGGHAKATLSVLGGHGEGAPFLPVAGGQYRIDRSCSIDVVVGSPLVRLALTDVQGHFEPGEGFSVTVTPITAGGCVLVPRLVLQFGLN